MVNEQPLDLRWSHRPNTYHDSVKLMRVSEALAAAPGVVKAAAVMATPLNVDLLANDGLLPPGIDASPDDLLITVAGENAAAAETALASIDELLQVHRREELSPEAALPRTLEAAAAAARANVAIIGVPGPNAALEAFAALRSGLHVFLFSDNVSIENEVRLKALASDLDLLMMGPDCGTAIVGGVGLGFANRVERGPVGIVGASGTGIQQVCCLLDAAGIGVAHAIGTGGRDLSAQVRGSMTFRALKMLEADDEVEVIAVISKPPDREVAEMLHAEMREVSKPVVACLFEERIAAEGSVRYVGTLLGTARSIREALGQQWSDEAPVPAARARKGGRVYGFYTGGTLCTEAERILDGFGVPHRLIDLGADEYTRGRAHPMIDPRLRASMLADLADRDDIGFVLADVVLGDLAHPDPAGVLLPGLQALQKGRKVPMVAALVGARRDPQGLNEQRKRLVRAGVRVFASNTEAAAFAGASLRSSER